MSATFASKNFLAWPSDAQLNHSIGQYSFCDYCRDPAGLFSPALIYPYFPFEPIRCQSCGELDEDIRSFNLITPQQTRIATPSFPTLGEVYHFGKIFGMSGFCLIEMRSFFYGERDADRRKESLANIAWGRKV